MVRFNDFYLRIGPMNDISNQIEFTYSIIG